MGARPGCNVRFLESVMSEKTINTRKSGDKEQVDKYYQLGLEEKNKKKHKPLLPPPLPHVSTPLPNIEGAARALNFELEESLDGSYLEKTLVADADTPESQSDDFENTILTDHTNTQVTNIGNNNNKQNNIEDKQNNFKQTNIKQDKKMPNNNPGNSGGTGSTNLNPFATLKYAVEAVPFFDGTSSALSYFIEGCEVAKSMLPKEIEPQFANILRTRIVGEARRTIEDQDFKNVSQLTSYLKKIYGPPKNIYQLQGELGRIYQKSDEDVITYANRVKFLGKQILETYKTTEGPAIDLNIKQTIENDMNRCFIRGLKPEIEQRITRNLNVHETVTDALRIERELREMTDLRQESGTVAKGNDKSQPRPSCQICLKIGHLASSCRKLTQFNPQNYNKAEVGTDILICQICKKRGHSADKCRLRDPRSQRPVNVVQEKIIICQLCSKRGHDAKSCRQNNANSQTDKTTIICQWCEKTGHSANNCWKKQNEERNQTTYRHVRAACQICDNFGHIAKDCRLKLNQSAASKESLFCRYCKEQGHLLENCQTRISNNKRKESEQGNRHGPSTSGAQQGSERETHPTKTQPTK